MSSRLRQTPVTMPIDNSRRLYPLGDPDGWFSLPRRDVRGWPCADNAVLAIGGCHRDNARFRNSRIRPVVPV